MAWRTKSLPKHPHLNYYNVKLVPNTSILKVEAASYHYNVKLVPKFSILMVEAACSSKTIWRQNPEDHKMKNPCHNTKTYVDNQYLHISGLTMTFHELRHFFLPLTLIIECSLHIQNCARGLRCFLHQLL
jgi:hypothetical protein